MRKKKENIKREKSERLFYCIGPVGSINTHGQKNQKKKKIRNGRMLIMPHSQYMRSL